MRALVLASVLIVGCVSGGGDAVSTTKDATTSDSTPSGADGNIFPVEDGAVEDTATGDTGAPSCGVPGKPCCTGDACSAGAYCNSALCWALPSATEEASDPDSCGDLGKAHPAPGFLSRFTIRGRPGAKAYRYYVKTSCGTAPPSLTLESPMTIGADGTYTFTIETPVADTDCANKNLGKYEVWFVVDGHETPHATATYFNSTCTTCAGAAKLCP